MHYGLGEAQPAVQSLGFIPEQMRVIKEFFNWRIMQLYMCPKEISWPELEPGFQELSAAERGKEKHKATFLWNRLLQLGGSLICIILEWDNPSFHWTVNYSTELMFYASLCSRQLYIAKAAHRTSAHKDI